MTRYLCKLLNVSRSGYYSYVKAADTRLERARLDAVAGERIKKAFYWKGFKKGSRSIKMVLQNEFGITYNLKRIRRLMKKLNLVCPHRKPNPYKRMARATLEHRTLPTSCKGISRRVFRVSLYLLISRIFRTTAKRWVICQPYWMLPRANFSRSTFRTVLIYPLRPKP